MKPAYVLFDLLFVVAAAVVYICATAAAIYCAGWLWGDSTLSKASAIALGYFLFLHFFVLSIGVLRQVFQPRLREGNFPIGFNRDYVAWGINSIFQGIMNASPFASQVFFIFYLNRIYYLLMGMKLPADSMIGTCTTIRQPELLHVGKNSVIGIHCKISGHHSPNRKIHCQGITRIGDNSLVGGACILMGPVTIGNNVTIGASTHMAPNTIIGDNSKVGGNCILAPGAKIPSNVIVKNNSYITHHMNIQEGEIWAGNPAARIGFVNDSDNDSNKGKPNHEKS